MKSVLTGGVASFTLHAGLVGAFVALSVYGPSYSSQVDVGIQIVREAGESDLRVKPLAAEVDVEFERIKLKVDLEHPMSFEDVAERPETRFDVEEGRPVPRPIPPEPALDRPIKPVARRIAPAPAATETAPSEVSNPPPEYPPLARRRGCEGSVVLAFEIMPDGTCGEVRVNETSGHKILDEAALRAVRGWRFKPATRAGLPIAATQRIRFTFRLQG